MKTRALTLITLTLLLMVIFPASAQDDLPPIGGSAGNLYRMLQLVPDNANARGWLGFSDFRAADQLHPESARLSLDNYASGGDLVRLWAINTPGLGFSELNMIGTLLDETYAATGVDFFAVDQALQWGSPPEQGTLLRGRFDQAVIDAALTQSGFVSEEIQGYTAWCNPDGCDEGMTLDMDFREPANFFGGNLGRRQPIVLAGDVLENDVLLSSPDLNVVAAALEQLTDKGADSLAQDDAYRAGLAAISAFTDERANGDTRPLVRQALFINPQDVILGDPLNADLNSLLAEVGTIPLYDLLILADMGTVDSQIAVAVLVFSDADSAADGANAIQDRLNLPSTVTDAPYLEMLTERGATLGDTFTFDAADEGKTVLIVPFDYDAVRGTDTMSAGVFYFIYNGLLRRDLLWLAPL